MHLLDTNVCVHLLNEGDAGVAHRFRELGPGRIALCSVVKAELLYGAHHSRRVDANMQRLEVFFAPLQSLPFDDTCAAHYGAIRNELAVQGAVIGPNDLFIAATARANGTVLVTNNTREFERVPGLRLEDWTQP